MPTARELLEQADALMRRNRRDETVTGSPVAPAPSTEADPSDARASSNAPDTASGTAIDDPLRSLLPDAPTLDDVQEVDAGAPLTPTLILPNGDDDWLASLVDLPILTDVVEIGSDARVVPGHADAAPIDLAAAGDAVDESVAPSGDPGALRDVPLPEPPMQATEAQPVADQSAVEQPVAEQSAAGQSAVEQSAAEQSAAEWSALAEEIRAQVLQRLDLFTDTGLREQLGAHLMPIVERASAELVDTINRQVGELVRSYVAEAIEREIEAWRNRGS